MDRGREADVTHGGVVPNLLHQFLLAEQGLGALAGGLKQAVLQRRKVHGGARADQAVAVVEWVGPEAKWSDSAWRRKVQDAEQCSNVAAVSMPETACLDSATG
jgi:hypothetical protein